jgi:hypothetical protein
MLRQRRRIDRIRIWFEPRTRVPARRERRLKHTRAIDMSGFHATNTGCFGLAIRSLLRHDKDA